MKVIAITNSKGGAGKTSHTVCLAGAFAETGLKVLVIDLDPQSSSSDWLAEEEGDEGFRNAWETQSSFSSLVSPTRTNGIDLIASSGEHMQDINYFADNLSITGLAAGIAKLPRNRWDMILIDCVPGTSPLAIAPLAAANAVLIPVELADMGVKGAAITVERITRYRDALGNPALHLAGICPFRARPGEVTYRDYLAQLSDLFPGAIMPPVRQDTRMGSAVSHGAPITTVAPRSNAAQDYRTLASALMARWLRENNHVAAA